MAYELDYNVEGFKWNRIPRRFATREELCFTLAQVMDVIDPKLDAGFIELRIRKVE